MERRTIKMRKTWRILIVVCAFLASSAGDLFAAFSDVTVSSGILLDNSGAYGAAWGDYDNDGDEDLYVTRKDKSRLYRNNGNGVFQDVTDAAGVGTNEAWGAAWGDFDNDGDLDLYVSRRSGVGFPNVLYVNTNGTFTDVADAMGVKGQSNKPSRTVSWADYDQDGLLDLYVANRGSSQLLGGVENLLFRNLGLSGFQSVAGSVNADAGRALSFTGLWSDYDNDGDLDLLVASDFHGVELLRNNGSSFTRATVSAFPGQLMDSLGPPTPGEDCKKSFSGDDHYVDQTQLPAHVHCLHDEPTSGLNPPSPTYGALPYNAMGICAGDYNNDGFMDYYVTNFVADDYIGSSGNNDDHGKFESVLWHNNGNGTFTERARAAGLNGLMDGNPANELRDPNGTVLYSVQERETVEWGCNFFDYDNDGDLDLYIVAGNTPGINDTSLSQRDSLYRNDGNGAFTDVTVTENFLGSGDDCTSDCSFDGEAGGLGSAVADIDDDGDLDLFVANNRYGSSRLYRNDQKTGNKWLKFRLSGINQKFGIGTRIEVTAGSVTRIREVISGSSYLSMDSLVQHFGLGSATRADEVQIFWPGGTIDVLCDQPVNQTIEIAEGSAGQAICAGGGGNGGGGGGNGGGGGGGCFIATAAFGSPMEPQVQLLREFRDRYLQPHEWGRKLIEAYYTYSPPAAEVVQGKEALRALVRLLLWPVIGIVWFIVKTSGVMKIALFIGLACAFIGYRRWRMSAA
jgi:enediyne biosynthesis protein E4